MSSWVFNDQLKTWQARGALAMPGLKHELYVDASDSIMFLSVNLKNVTPCNLKFPWRRPCHCLALGDGENVKPEVGADSFGAATERASAHPSTAQALARTCTM